MSFALQYHTMGPEERTDQLELGHCTIKRCSRLGEDVKWWELWALVARETDGQPELIGVPINPNGDYIEQGPGGKTWGLKRVDATTWQVSPSIDVYDEEDARRLQAGLPRHDKSVWHQTPALVYVPPDAPWITEKP